MRNRRNYEGALAMVTENSDVTLKLSRDMNIKRLWCVLTGTMTISAGASSGTPTDTPLSLLRDIEIILNGKNTIKNFDGEGIRAKNTIFNSIPFTQTVIADGDAAVTNFRAPFLIHFEGARNAQPMDTILNARHFTEILLKINFGAAAHMVIGGDRTLVLTNVKVQVESENTIGPDWYFNQFAETFNSYTIAATGELPPIELPKNGKIRRIYILTHDGSANSDDVLDYLDLQVDLTYFPRKKNYFKAMKDENEAMFKIRPPTGWAVMDFTSEGGQNFMLDTSIYSRVDFIGNSLDATATMKLYYDWYIKKAI